MSHIRKGILILAVLVCLVPLVALRCSAAEETEPYIQKMIQYYHHYQEDASGEIDVLLDYLQDIAPKEAALWRQIMADWDTLGRKTEVPMDVLPDGLPEDDSLCILVLGYDLTDDGSMRPELIARLQTALRSAKKYPNAYIAVTGGPTAENTRDTEAGAMAKWLIESGIPAGQVIVEKKAMSTTENATRTYRILAEDYPQVTSVAVISSEYHVTTGCVLFQTASTVGAARGGPEIQVVGNAGATTGKSYDALGYQTRGICTITGIPYPKSKPPALTREPAQ